MAKKVSLSSALSEAARGGGETVRAEKPTPKPKAVPSASVAGSKAEQPYRAGKVNVTGYFDPAVKQSIRLIQAKHPGLKLQDLLAEALNDLFAKYNVPQAANLSKVS